MICDQLVTEVASWLRDPASGVNTQLPLVPRPVGEAAPPAVTVLDVYTDAQVAKGKIDDQRLDEGPFLVLVPAASASFAGVLFDGSQDSQELALSYVDGRSDAHVALRDAHRTLRAARRVLALRFAALGNAALSLGGCTIDAPGAMRVLTADGEGGAQVHAQAFLPFPITDRWALGAPA